MSEPRRPSGPATFTRLGLSRTELTAAIVAELEQIGSEPRPADIAAAVAGAIEANNEQILRHLNQSPVVIVGGGDLLEITDGPLRKSQA